ncbi:MAG: S1 RNA-binding domain-containing protein [Lachnospiraceae bacterium]|nr:S1 RNA-binding domain-containing protein [Lachnospiraceae bacterium]
MPRINLLKGLTTKSMQSTCCIICEFHNLHKTLLVPSNELKMKKEDLLNEMYLLLKKFDDDMLQLMKFFRKNGELQDEITVGDSVQPDDSIEASLATQLNIVEDIKLGDIFVGTVVSIMNFGAFVEFAPGKDGMIHISKLSDKRVEKVEDVVKLGDTVKVEIIKVGDKGIDLKLIEKIH